jgi:hypothetical protein
MRQVARFRLSNKAYQDLGRIALSMMFLSGYDSINLLLLFEKNAIHLWKYMDGVLCSLLGKGEKQWTIPGTSRQIKKTNSPEEIQKKQHAYLSISGLYCPGLATRVMNALIN